MSVQKFVRLLIGVGILMAFVLPASAQDFPLQFLSNCQGGAFSTEEDFMMQRGEPYDGNPYISDGDVLSPTGQLCARNRELLARFDVREDLGLDALHLMPNLLGENEHVVAFSTELDDPNGNFTAGDLLFTTGAILRNEVLVKPFGIPNNVGLDGVDIVGSDDAVRRLVIFIGQSQGDVDLIS